MNSITASSDEQAAAPGITPRGEDRSPYDISEVYYTPLSSITTATNPNLKGHMKRDSMSMPALKLQDENRQQEQSGSIDLRPRASSTKNLLDRAWKEDLPL